MSFFTPEEAAVYAGVPLETLMEWIESDRLIGVAHDRLMGTRIYKPALDRFLDPNPPPIPSELFRPVKLQDLIDFYEEHFGLSTTEMLRMQDRGEAPELRDGYDERIYDQWRGTMRRLAEDGRLDIIASLRKSG